MKPSIPYGGFFASSYTAANKDVLCARLQQSNARWIVLEKAGLVLAAWNEFTGQGLWGEGDAVVAYDVDLTNVPQLKLLAGMTENEAIDPGRLLWGLYRKFGIDFVDKLRGAFAFALWDGAEQKLVAVTDYYGIRPVVFSRQNGGFAVASRIRQLQHVGLEKDINPEAIYHYLFYQAICSPISIYKEVYKLEAGRGLCFERGQVSEFTWYDIRYQPDGTKSEDHWCKAISQEVEKAVEAFVPSSGADKTGCFLSGGTDSSSVVGFFNRFTETPVKTFSIGFDDPKFNELDFARMAAKRFGTDPYEYLVTAKDVLDLIDYLPKIYDEPLGNASVVAAYYCAKLAGEHGIDVMLGGDGGDEIFGGNERYVTDLIFQRYARLPAPLRKGFLEPLLGMMPSTGLFYKAKRYVRRANMPNPRRFYSYNLLAEMDNREIFQPDFLTQVDPDCFFQSAQRFYDQAAPADDTDRLLYLDMKFTITDNDLRKVTPMVEAAGLQVRYPLLDRDLVDFASTIPPWLKVKPGKNRYMFKRAMEGFLPDEILRKSKHGMGLPIARWLKEDPRLSQLVGDTVFSDSALMKQFVRPQYIEQLKSHFMDDPTGYYGDNLWVFLILENWLQNRAHSQDTAVC